MTDTATEALPAYNLEIVRGVEGVAVYLNECRIAGPKPWGGGDVIHRWKVPRSAIGDAIGVEPWEQAAPAEVDAIVAGLRDLDHKVPAYVATICKRAADVLTHISARPGITREQLYKFILDNTFTTLNESVAIQIGTYERFVAMLEGGTL